MISLIIFNKIIILIIIKKYLIKPIQTSRNWRRRNIITTHKCFFGQSVCFHQRLNILRWSTRTRFLVIMLLIILIILICITPRSKATTSFFSSRSLCWRCTWRLVLISANRLLYTSEKGKSYSFPSTSLN